MGKINWIAALALTGLLAMTRMAQAEEQTPSVYSPDFCEFTITFPSEPYKTQSCQGEDQSDCVDKISFTQVYDLSSTVNFRVLCNPIDESVRQTYSGKVMEGTLKALTKDSVVKTFESSFREEENYKQAGLVGEGKVGTLPTIYIAQLWIGDHSAFSVEAELIGAENTEADTLFSEVLKSVRFVDKKAEADAAAAEEGKAETEKEPDAEAPSP